MDLPLHTLKAQLDAAYFALETMARDRKKWRERTQVESARAQAENAEAVRLRVAYEALTESFATLTAQAEQSQQALALSEARRQAADQLIEQMLASRSWRLTKPLRCAGLLARRVIPSN